MNLEDVHLFGLRSAQPAFASTAKGILYFVTDEGVLEINTGAAWVAYSAAAAAAINQLTGDVTAGPGSGSQVTTIGALKVLTGMLAAGAVTEAKQTLADNTTWNVDTTKHGYAPKAPNVATQYLNGVGAWSVPAGGASEWTTIGTQATDQDVTNSIVLVDATGLIIPVTAASVWLMELLLVYSGNSPTNDLQSRFAVSAGVMTGTMLSTALTGGDTHTNTTYGSFAAAQSGQLTNGVTSVIGTPRGVWAKGIMQFTAAGNFTFQFAESAAFSATTVRIWAGSILRGKRLV